LKVLYLGDGPLGGPSSYLYGVLKYCGFSVDHLPPHKKLAPRCLKKAPQVIVLSDYPFQHLKKCEKQLTNSIQEGAGLLMVGGWSSFSGGGYRGTDIEDLLPVKIQKGDDRLNYSPGLRAFPKIKHPVFKGISFTTGPVLCGLNRILPRSGSKTVLEAYPFVFKASGRVLKGKKAYPLLVLGQNKFGRTAAFTSDFAPHWAGGLVDWGSKRIRIRVPKKKVFIEVGNDYIHFIQNLILWLADNKGSRR
jgi:uncharacterized membrane protein